MPRSKHLTTRGRQTFCVYCQKDYESPEKLAAHIRRVHPNTYANRDVVIEEGKDE